MEGEGCVGTSGGVRAGTRRTGRGGGGGDVGTSGGWRTWKGNRRHYLNPKSIRRGMSALDDRPAPGPSVRSVLPLCGVSGRGRWSLLGSLRLRRLVPAGRPGRGTRGGPRGDPHVPASPAPNSCATQYVAREPVPVTQDTSDGLRGGRPRSGHPRPLLSTGREPRWYCHWKPRPAGLVCVSGT